MTTETIEPIENEKIINIKCNATDGTCMHRTEDTEIIYIINDGNRKSFGVGYLGEPHCLLANEIVDFAKNGYTIRIGKRIIRKARESLFDRLKEEGISFIDEAQLR